MVFEPPGEDAGGIGDVVGTDGVTVEFELVAAGFRRAQPTLPFDAGETGVADAAIGQVSELDRSAGVDKSAHAVGGDFARRGRGDRRGVDDRHGAARQSFRGRCAGR
jgi:hypothetical protein